MILIICTEDRWGMAFNGRRLSMDRAVREKMLEIAAGKTLWMSGYSRKQFEEEEEKGPIRVDDRFLEKAGKGEYCFAELEDVTPYGDRLEGIILFRWNRRYPADQYFDPELLKSFHLVKTEEFPGSSHEKITMEVYSL